MKITLDEFESVLYDSSLSKIVKDVGVNEKEIYVSFKEGYEVYTNSHGDCTYSLLLTEE